MLNLTIYPSLKYPRGNLKKDNSVGCHILNTLRLSIYFFLENNLIALFNYLIVQCALKPYPLNLKKKTK